MFTVKGNFRYFLEKQNLDEPSKRKFEASITKILNRTGLEVSGNRLCQLVVGQVQSGKTMSFTGLIAAARDNEVPIIIVIAGTKKNLFNQSVERLEKDLQLHGDGGANPWLLKQKPNRSEALELARLLQSWSDTSIPTEFKKTAIIVALKSKAGITKLSELMADIGQQVDLSKIKVLIIDDEADQASLNTKSKSKKNEDDKPSAIYAAITQLRNSLPFHSFVMYTATPQAPLLLRLADHLSPEYVTLLTPGEDYLGGKELFTSISSFPIEIPLSDIDIALDPHHTNGAPKSLRAALAYYLLSLTVAQERRNPRPLTMMIHPDSSIALHHTFEIWVKAILDEWQASLADASESSYKLLMDEEFKEALKGLENTVKLPIEWKSASTSEATFQEMLRYTRNWINQIAIRVINGENPDIDPAKWTSHAGWIIIGGNKLERGFTVENLAVTYMPRGSGVGNADVIQQRARFFGYKRKYQDLLRAWLSPETIQNYIDYVEHEIEMHNQLRDIDDNDLSLKNWRRKFLLDKSMNICRSQVQGLPVAHEQLKSGFVFRQSQLFGENLKHNEKLVEKINKQKNNIKNVSADLRPDKYTEISSIDTVHILEILADWNASPAEREQIDRLIYSLQIQLEKNPNLGFSIYTVDMVIGGFQQTRKRSSAELLDDKDIKYRNEWRIKNLFQGKNPKSGPEIYPGDDKLRSRNDVTIQIHKVSPSHGESEYETVYAIAVSMPDFLTSGIVWELEA